MKRILLITVAVLFVGVALCAAFIAHAQQPINPRLVTAGNNLSLAVKEWCVSQHWLGHPEPDGSITYTFVGKWTAKQKGRFVAQCDAYNRSVVRKFVIPKRNHAQQPTKPEAPKPVTLSAEASREWIEDQRQINELQLKIDKLQLQQQLLAAKAQVPDNYIVAGLDGERRVVYAPPVKPEVAKVK